MSIRPDRRQVLRMALAGGASTALPTLSYAGVTAFKQGVAEAASSDEDLARFYRETNYAPIWTGENDAERRHAFLNALFLQTTMGFLRDAIQRRHLQISSMALTAHEAAGLRKSKLLACS